MNNLEFNGEKLNFNGKNLHFYSNNDLYKCKDDLIEAISNIDHKNSLYIKIGFIFKSILYLKTLKPIEAFSVEYEESLSCLKAKCITLFKAARIDEREDIKNFVIDNELFSHIEVDSIKDLKNEMLTIINNEKELMTKIKDLEKKGNASSFFDGAKKVFLSPLTPGFILGGIGLIYSGCKDITEAEEIPEKTYPIEGTINSLNGENEGIKIPHFNPECMNYTTNASYDQDNQIYTDLKVEKIENTDCTLEKISKIALNFTATLKEQATEEGSKKSGISKIILGAISIGTPIVGMLYYGIKEVKDHKAKIKELKSEYEENYAKYKNNDKVLPMSN